MLRAMIWYVFTWPTRTVLGPIHSMLTPGSWRPVETSALGGGGDSMTVGAGAFTFCLALVCWTWLSTMGGADCSGKLGALGRTVDSGGATTDGGGTGSSGCAASATAGGTSRACCPAAGLGAACAGATGVGGGGTVTGGSGCPKTQPTLPTPRPTVARTRPKRTCCRFILMSP